MFDVLLTSLLLGSHASAAVAATSVAKQINCGDICGRNSEALEVVSRDFFLSQFSLVRAKKASVIFNCL